jgi:hypothetical protein
MRRLPVPQVKACDVFASAIGAFHDSGLLARFTAAQAVIVSEETQYARLAQAGRLDLVQASASVNSDLSVDEMKELYRKGMSSASGPARPFYDKLVTAAPHGTCPLCGQGRVRTLDHYLPQSKYPALVVTPINLIPACRDCNTAKLNKAPTTAGEQTMHPYFDDFTSVRWLRAKVAESDPPVILYETRLPEGWPPVIAERLRRHMATFKLATTFTLYAGEQMSEIAGELQLLHSTGGADAVRQELQTRAGKREQTHRNSWQTAMYFGLAESEWFCTQGLFLLKPTAVTTMAA